MKYCIINPALFNDYNMRCGCIWQAEPRNWENSTCSTDISFTNYQSRPLFIMSSADFHQSVKSAELRWFSWFSAVVSPAARHDDRQSTRQFLTSLSIVVVLNSEQTLSEAAAFITRIRNKIPEIKISFLPS